MFIRYLRDFVPQVSLTVTHIDYISPNSPAHLVTMYTSNEVVRHNLILLSLSLFSSPPGMTKQSYIDAVLQGIDNAIRNGSSHICVR